MHGINKGKCHLQLHLRAFHALSIPCVHIAYINTTEGTLRISIAASLFDIFSYLCNERSVVTWHWIANCCSCYSLLQTSLSPSLALSLCIYIYIYIHLYLYIYMYVCDFIQRNYGSIGRNACGNNAAKFYGYRVYFYNLDSVIVT